LWIPGGGFLCLLAGSCIWNDTKQKKRHLNVLVNYAIAQIWVCPIPRARPA
jgi:hypothetical protein